MHRCAGLQVRFSGRQFDDDLNLFPLSRATTVDVLAARPLGGGTELYAAAENLFDARYDVGRTPVRTLGSPRSLSVRYRHSLSPGLALETGSTM